MARHLHTRVIEDLIAQATHDGVVDQQQLSELKFESEEYRREVRGDFDYDDDPADFDDRDDFEPEDEPNICACGDEDCQGCEAENDGENGMPEDFGYFGEMGMSED